jgi:hypothetical protein
VVSGLTADQAGKDWKDSPDSKDCPEPRETQEARELTERPEHPESRGRMALGMTAPVGRSRLVVSLRRVRVRVKARRATQELKASKEYLEPKDRPASPSQGRKDHLGLMEHLGLRASRAISAIRL